MDLLSACLRTNNGLQKAPNGGTMAVRSMDALERMWCAFAWQNKGRSAFFYTINGIMHYVDGRHTQICWKTRSYATKRLQRVWDSYTIYVFRRCGYKYKYIIMRKGIEKPIWALRVWMNGSVYSFFIYDYYVYSTWLHFCVLWRRWDWCVNVRPVRQCAILTVNKSIASITESKCEHVCQKGPTLADAAWQGPSLGPLGDGWQNCIISTSFRCLNVASCTSDFVHCTSR